MRLVAEVVASVALVEFPVLAEDGEGGVPAHPSAVPGGERVLELGLVESVGRRLAVAKRVPGERPMNEAWSATW